MRNKQKDYEAQRRWFSRNPNYKRNWNRQNATQINEQARLNYAERRGEILTRRREAYALNRDEMRAKERERSHREGPARDHRKHRWRERYAKGKLNFDWVQTLKGDPCSYCGGPGGQIDHVVALTRGGTNDSENLTAACARCNTSKGNRPILLFLLDPWRRK